MARDFITNASLAEAIDGNERKVGRAIALGRKKGQANEDANAALYAIGHENLGEAAEIISEMLADGTLPIGAYLELGLLPGRT